MTPDPFNDFLNNSARAQKARAELFEAQSQGVAAAAEATQEVSPLASIIVWKDGSSTVWVPDGASYRRGVALLLHHLAEVLEQLEEESR